MKLNPSLTNPTIGLVKTVREGAGLTQAQAAEMVHLGNRVRWNEYERGVQPIDGARWELFLVKVGKHQLYAPRPGVPVPTSVPFTMKEPPEQSVGRILQDIANNPALARKAGSGKPGPRNRP